MAYYYMDVNTVSRQSTRNKTKRSCSNSSIYASAYITGTKLEQHSESLDKAAYISGSKLSTEKGVTAYFQHNRDVLF